MKLTPARTVSGPRLAPVRSDNASDREAQDYDKAPGPTCDEKPGDSLGDV